MRAVENFNLDMSLSADELRIIGVEFNIVHPDNRVSEMGMFVPNGNGLVIPRVVSANHWYGGRYRPQITFHSTVGDYTLYDVNGGCPWL